MKILKNSSAFSLLYHPRSLKFLKKLEQLCSNPNSQGLDIKRLATTQKSFRLRVGKIRVVYEIDQNNKTIYVQDIDFRGNIY